MPTQEYEPPCIIYHYTAPNKSVTEMYHCRAVGPTSACTEVRPSGWTFTYFTDNVSGTSGFQILHNLNVPEDRLIVTATTALCGTGLSDEDDSPIHFDYVNNNQFNVIFSKQNKDDFAANLQIAVTSA